MEKWIISSSITRRNRAVLEAWAEIFTALAEGPEGTDFGFILPASFLTEGEAIEVRNTNRKKLEKEGHMRQAKYRYFLLPLFLVLACAGLYAQANSDLTGIVTDQTGAVVAGAKVALTDTATSDVRTTISSGTGLYDVAGLNPATYNLKVTAKGFEAYVQNGIVIATSSTVRADVKLTVGAETQTVTVQADALTVQADSNVVSTLITSEQISEIATENRNFAALAALGLGVSSALPDNNTPGAFSSNFTISVNGLRQSHNIWLIDGGESDDRGGAGGMQIQPSQDAIAEFTMMTSNYPPDYGISSGATISLSLKSGTQKFHGSAWEENRNTDYNANSFFNNFSTPVTQRPAVHYNIYGFNVGGPLYIPHTYNVNKQKTFFFWNEEWRKTVNLASSTNTTIDAADIPAIGQTTPLTYKAPGFSPGTVLRTPNLTGAVWYNAGNPGAGLTPNVPWAAIPATLFDPNWILYLHSGALPPSNVTVGGVNQDKNIASVSLPFKVRDDIVRVDHKFNDKWAILGHYIGDMQNQSNGGPELGWCWCSYNTLTSILASPAHSAAIKLTGQISPDLLVEASINYDGNGADITPSSNSYKPASWSVQPVVPAYAITRKVWPGITGFGGPYWTAEDTATEPYHNAAQDYEPKIDLSYTKGRHAMKFGFSWNRYTKNQMLYGDEQGTYGSNTMTGDGIMDLLIGLAGSYSQEQGAPIRHYVNNTPSVYAMDNWHVTPRLSLQLGIRYDALPHAWERDNLLGNFTQASYVQTQAPIWDNSGAIDPASPDLYTWGGVPSYINGTNLAGIDAYPRGVVNNDYKTWQPRLGFSEDITGNGKTVLRGGFGTFYERMQGNDVFGVATSAPYDPSLSVGSIYFSNPGTNWQTGTVISPSSLIFATPGTSLAQYYRAPAAAMFSLGVQRELAPSLIWVVQYIGNLAWHQNHGNNINNYPLNVGFANPNTGATSSSPGTGLVSVECLSGDSGNHYGETSYNAGNGIDAACKPGLGVSHAGVPVFPAGGNQFRTYQGYTGIGQDQNDTNGGYNGFQTGLRVQNRWGLSGEVDYTWSHEIDITSYDNGGGVNVDNPWYYKYDKGSGALDRRHMLSINYVYKLPFFAKSSGLVHSIAGGWEFAGTVIDESGTPSPSGETLNYDAIGLDGGYTSRANLVGKMTYNHKMNSFFNTGGFSSQAPEYDGGVNLGFGDAGKDAIVGPGRVNFTTSMYKSFAITDKARFELRFESFNTFNHTEPSGINTGYNPGNGTPSTVLGAGNTFGQVTSTWDPRALELGGKFIF
jgi:hypothetical protein